MKHPYQHAVSHSLWAVSADTHTGSSSQAQPQSQTETRVPTRTSSPTITSQAAATRTGELTAAAGERTRRRAPAPSFGAASCHSCHARCERTISGYISPSSCDLASVCLAPPPLASIVQGGRQVRHPVWTQRLRMGRCLMQFKCQHSGVYVRI